MSVESLYLLIPISVLLVFLIGAIFWWALKSGQLDDLEGPAYRVLMDDDSPHKPSEGERREGSTRSVDADQSN